VRLLIPTLSFLLLLLLLFAGDALARYLRDEAARGRQCVDSRLNMYSVRGPKIDDLSIGPGNVSANMYSTALVIGERAAVIIAEELNMASRVSSEKVTVRVQLTHPIDFLS
jgi:hypothetical protein